MPEEWREHTFVICAYKESEYLEDCIRSLKKQTIKSEILMATSTPNDYISGLAEKYQIPLFINEGDSNIAGDWNFAYHQAATPYVTLAHQDDIYQKEYAAHAREMMEKCRTPLIFFCNYYELRWKKLIKDNSLLKVKRYLAAPLALKKAGKSRLVRRRLLGLGNYICCPSVTYAKENLPKTLFKTGFRSNVDWEAWEEVSRLDGSFLYDKAFLMAHRIHEGSETTAVIEETGREEEDYEMLCRFWPKRIAGLLERVYKQGEKSNQTEINE